MKKIFLLLLILVSYFANAQIKIFQQLRWIRVSGVWRLQVDSIGNNNWRNFATQEYVQGWVASHGGGGGATIDSLSQIGYRPFGALQDIPTTISGYGISDAVNVSRSINTGFGILGGGNFTADRTFRADTLSSGLATWMRLKKVTDSLSILISSAGGGTVLSVSRTNGYGISASVSDPSVNPNITIGIDSAVLAAYFLRDKDSVAGGYYPYSSNPKGYLVSSDLSGYVPTTRTVNGKLLSSNITLVLASSDFANQGTATTVLHGNASGAPSFSQIVNADVSSSAAIAYSKLALTGSIVNADISGSAAIAYSKLNLTGSILNGDIVNGTIDLSTKVTGNLAVSHFNSGTNAASDTWWNGVGIWDTLPNITFNVQSPLYPLNDSTLAIRIVSTSDTGVVTPAMKILWDGKISGLTVGTTTIASGTTTRILYDNAGVLGEYPIGTGVATFLATPSSANLATAVTDETGSGALVFGTSPNFTTGITIGSVAVPTISSTNTLTNKRWVARVDSTTSSATPTINTDNVDIYYITAQAADITSFTTNISGTPTIGQVLEIVITGTGSRAITWGSKFASSANVTLPTTTSGTTTLSTIFQWGQSTTSYGGTGKWVVVNSY